MTGNVTNCNFTNNKATNGNGGAILFASKGNVTNCNFTNNSAYYGGAVYFLDTGEVTNCNFTNNSATYGGGAIRFSSAGTVTNCNFTNNSASYGGAIRFNGEGTVTNCNFTNNTAGDWGGAVYFSWETSGEVINCNFTNNSAPLGGAIYFQTDSNGNVTNCNFINNNATRNGGAIIMSLGTVTNCNFTGNNATTSSAIYFYKWDSSDTLTVSDSTFLNNRANAEALDVVKNDNNITITFTGHNNLLNAIYSREDAEVAFTNVKYWGATGITTVSARLSGSNKAAGQNITVGVVVNGEIVLNNVKVTDENGMIVLDITAGENYYIGVRHDTDSYYTEAEKTISNNTKFNVNVTSQTTNNKTVNITAKSNIYSEIMPGKLSNLLLNSMTFLI
ncbi:right-handed parallel beta-helix repeat-containing protein [Methanobrevibacter thaueri]|uniref:right-handed parallel beta-helix repeat-containing protein n=1 Tax=Methanobrevibacter thaueri TaxID=190975 RepID=UPI000E30673E|nr:right-handed parallel beta-helix repeat-containing protein [Methanobrevibacter thaueri]